MKKRGEGDIAFCIQLVVLVFLVNILFSLLLQLTGFIHVVSERFRIGPGWNSCFHTLTCPSSFENKIYFV